MVIIDVNLLHIKFWEIFRKLCWYPNSRLEILPCNTCLTWNQRWSHRRASLCGASPWDLWMPLFNLCTASITLQHILLCRVCFALHDFLLVRKWYHVHSLAFFLCLWWFYFFPCRPKICFEGGWYNCWCWNIFKSDRLKSWDAKHCI